MPLYESVMQEKPPVVLDLGSAYTKLGFASEAFPRKIIPSEVVLFTTGKKKHLYDYITELELYDQLVDFLQTIFFKYLLVSPKDRKILVVENVFNQTVLRDTLARVLFKHFEVSSIFYVPSHMIALSTLAIPTGVVVDVGYNETTIVPIFSGVQIMHAFCDQSYGGKAIHKEIKRQLLHSGVQENLLTETVLEDIKVRACFVTTLERAQAYRNNNKIVEPPSTEYTVCNSDIISISGRLRETAFEIMFEETNERDSLPHLILQSILKCTKEIRKELLENILLIGGSTIITGFSHRLKEELQHMVKSDLEYKKRFHGDIKIKFHKTIGRQNFTAWLGGSLCGGTDLIQSRSLVKEVYLKNNHVPDWICLTDNRTNGS